MKRSSLCIGMILVWGTIFFTHIIAESEERDFLGKMVYIPSGEFTMGADDPKLQMYYDVYGFPARLQKKAEPAKKVHLEGFYIDVHEVTNGQYKKFVDDVHYTPPTHWENGTYPKGKENYPVVNVSWFDARAYAKWAGKRLPSEEEWEKAARGGGQRIFPWGDQIEGAMAELWSVAWESAEGSQKVGNFSFDKSPYGVIDMAGGVMEWTASTYEYEGVRSKGRRSEEIRSGTEVVVKGGAWSSEIEDVKISRKIFSPPDQVSNGVGFRCAK